MPARRPATETRTVVLGAARRRFADEGYERATVRAIAADARVDPAVVIRLFGSKADLFAASAAFDVALPDLAGLDTSAAAGRLASHVSRVWEDDPTFLALLRVAATHETAAARVRAVFTEQIAPAVAARGVDHADRRAALITSHVLGVAFTRLAVRLEPIASMDRAELAAWLTPTLAHYLAADAPEVLRTGRP